MQMKSKIRLGVVFLIASSLVVGFQNCDSNSLTRVGNEIRDNDFLQSIKGESGGGNGEGYQGKVMTYVALDEDQVCSVRQQHKIAIKEKIEMSGSLILKTVSNCKELNPPAIIPLENVYIAKRSSVVVIDNTLFRQAKVDGKKEVYVDRDYAFMFCTNMYHAKPAEGIEVRVIHLPAALSGNYKIQVWMMNLKNTLVPEIYSVFHRVRYTAGEHPKLQSIPQPDGSAVTLVFPSADSHIGKSLISMSYSPSPNLNHYIEGLRCWGRQ